MQHLLLVLVISWLHPQPFSQTKHLAQATEKKLETTPPELSEAGKLSQEALSSYEQGKYAEALPLAKRCLELREKALGQSHELVATSLNNVAGIHVAEARYAEAEPLYRRSLTILENKFGKDSNYLTNTL